MLQATLPDRIQQLEAENEQLRQAASKRSQALAQARHFIDNNLQRSSAMLKGSPDSSDVQGNGVRANSAQAGEGSSSGL